MFDKIKGPVFLKKNSTAQEQLKQLEALYITASDNIKKRIEQEIRIVKAGIEGEKQIEFELKNSHIPMFILHDVYFSFEGLNAQIDYLIVTRKRIFVIECKNLIGNIEVNNSGDFIRTTNYNGKYQKEGIYSPITQNKRHLELLKAMRCADKNVLLRSFFQKYFYENYRAIVVLAHPKTVLNAKYAKKDVKEQVIRADQLINYINRVNSEPSATFVSEQDAQNLAMYFLSKSGKNPNNYLEKFKEKINSIKQDINKTEKNCNQQNKIMCPKCGAVMIERRATRGANIGNVFYGCSNYPKCRGIVNVR